MPPYVWKNCTDHATGGIAKAMIFDRGQGATPRHGMAMCPHCICCGQDSDCVGVATPSDYDMKVILPASPFADDNCEDCDQFGGAYYLTWDSGYTWIYLEDEATCAYKFKLEAWAACWCDPFDPNLPEQKCYGALMAGFWIEAGGGSWVQNWWYRQHPVRNCRTSWSMPFYTKSGSGPCQTDTYPSSLDMELVPK